MTSKKPPPSRRARQTAKQQQAQRRRMLTIGLAIAAVVIIVGLGFMIRQARAPKLEDIILPESLAAPPNADGTNWGPADAPVVIEEFSDFQ